MHDAVALATCFDAVELVSGVVTGVSSHYSQDVRLYSLDRMLKIMHRLGAESFVLARSTVS